jgi:CTD small phosphatase-like protein 2
VKDLRIINRDQSKIFLIDNAAYSYTSQIDNGIPIIPYYEGKNDFELKALE